MTTITRAARAGAAFLVFAASACSSTGGLGSILGSVLGGNNNGSQVSGTVQGLNTRNQQIGLRDSNGQSLTLTYDNNTQVVYQNRNYPVTSLESGDRVTARVTNSNNSNGGYYTDLIQVDQSVSSNGSSGGVNGNNNVQTFEGTVRNIDRTNGLFALEARNYGTTTISLPYNLRQTDLNKFQSLRNGDYVRLYGVAVNNTRVELRQFY